jgi:hypothetical protein
MIDNVSIRYEIGVQNYPWWSPNFVHIGYIGRIDAMKLSRPVPQCLKQPIVCAFFRPSL